MIQFDNEIVELVCKQMLTKEENELKLIHFNPEKFLPGQCVGIGNTREYLEALQSTRDIYMQTVKAYEKAIILTKLAVLNDARVIEVES